MVSDKHPQFSAGEGFYARALRDMALRYERLVQAFSILRQMEEIDEPGQETGAICQRILEVLTSGLAASNSSLMLVNEDANFLELRAFCSPVEERGRAYRPDEWHGRRFAIGEGIVGIAAQTQRAIRIDDVRLSDDFVILPDSPVEIGSLLCFPLCMRGRTIGVLNLSHPETGAFTEESENVLALIAERAARILTTHVLTRQLRQTEVHYQLATRNAPNAIVIYNADGCIVSANPALERISGRPCRDFLDGKVLWSDGIVEEDRARYLEHQKRLRESAGEDSSQTIIGYAYTDASGARHHLEERSAPFADEETSEKGVVSVITDVTSRKDTEEELLRYRTHLEELVEERNAALVQVNQKLQQQVRERVQGEEERMRLATAIEQAGEAFVVTDAGSVIQYANPAFEAITGHGRAEAVGQRLLRYLDFSRENRTDRTDMWQTVRSGQVWKGRVAVRRGNEEKVHLESTVSPVRDSRGEVAHYVCVASDISQELRLEARLRQAQKMEAIGTLAGGIAHDFNNLLQVILGYTEFARSNSSDPDRVAMCLEQVHSASRRAMDLVGQILTFSRQREEEHRPVLLQPILKESLKLLRGSIPVTVEIRESISPTCGRVRADATQIHQIIINICTNAYHAMRETGGVLEVRLEEVAVDGRTAQSSPGWSPGKYARMTFSDTGCGMDPTTCERIFEPYFTTKRVGEGTGLGLAIVHGIVQSHEGVVLVDTKPGEGARFAVYLPVCDGGSPGDGESAGAGDDLRGSERVLFVDDEEQIALLAEMSLAQFGYQVQSFTDGRTALEVFTEDPGAYDVVVTDQTMPGLTGYELARRIMQVRPETPIVLSTGHSDTVDEEKALAAGIRRYVSKPLTAERLAEAVRFAIDVSFD